MAVRTNDTLVGEVIEVDEGANLAPFIRAASELVTELCTTSGYSVSRLEMIETWLAAHFYAIREPRATQEGVDGVNVQYQSKVDLGLRNTHYGQQAMRLDTAGNLAALDNSADKVTRPMSGSRRGKSVNWLGTPAEEQT